MKVQKLLSPVAIEVKFGNKGVYPIKGIVKTIGVSDKGNKWFSLLCCKKVEQKTSFGTKAEGYIYAEREFNLASVVKGAEQIAPLFETLEDVK